jgi:methyl-accepting chemotaxis protein
MSDKVEISAFAKSMVDLSPINTMMADKEGNLIYMNAKSLETLKSLQQFLPDSVDKLVGQSIDIFHKNPAFQQSIIGDPANLPRKAIISVGPEKLDLLVSPISDESGEYLGPMVTWEVVTEKLALEEKMSQAMQMNDKSPTNIIFSTPDGTITYINENSIETLRGLEEFLPCKADEILGGSIDRFHKNPAHQLNIIGNPANLPHRAIINVGPEKLDLLVSPIKTAAGDYLGAMVTWEVVTEKLALEEKMAQAMQMNDKSPTNIIFSTPEGHITYINENSIKTLSGLEAHLPCKVKDILGGSIDRFHKNPAHQLKIIGNPANLPHRAVINVGPEKLDLLVSAIEGANGEYLGAMVTWEVITEKFNLITGLKDTVKELNSSAQDLLEVSTGLSSSAEETSAQANTASAASEEVNAGVQTVATNMEEMTAAIKEITKTTNESSSLSNSAMKMAESTNAIISQLGDSSTDIGNVIKVISSIAQQTNLLALNATIEAARAGEAGKGFAVVANEVKELAKQTANATQDITKKIEAIQGDSSGAVDAIAEISDAINKINGYAGSIAASVEEQAATTNDVTRIVTESAEGINQINENIGQVSTAAAETGKGASQAQEAAKVLGDLATRLDDLVKKVEV